MAGRWWRAYDEALHDPKLQRLPPAMFKAWFNLMCVASKHAGILPPIGDLAYELHTNESGAAAILACLFAKKLIDRREDGRYEPHNWTGRQFQSDVSTERVKRFRGKQRNVSSTVSETSPDTDTDTDTEKKDLVGAADAPPKKVSRRTNLPIPSNWKPNEQHGALAHSLSVDVSDTEQRFRDYCASNGKLYADHDAAFRNFIKNAPRFNGTPNGHRGSRPLQNGGKQHPSDLALDLAEQARELERQAGISR